ncbi:MAG: hypothetical protein R3182_14305 [Draconibacterium sp.]|nr:hypothetical protein [Draconibacterium sp.]
MPVTRKLYTMADIHELIASDCEGNATISSYNSYTIKMECPGDVDYEVGMDGFIFQADLWNEE